MRNELLDESNWKSHASWDAANGYYALETRDTAGVPVRLFLNQALFVEAEPTLYRQIINATQFPGVKMVVVTPDVHYGYGVPVGCVIISDRDRGAVAMGPVGFDIGCGMVSAKSDVDAGLATHDRKLAFHREVLKRVALGPGGANRRFGALSKSALQEMVRGGAEHYVSKYGAPYDRSRAERHRIPVRDA